MGQGQDTSAAAQSKSGEFDSHALQVAREIAGITALNECQRLARIQVSVTGAMKWAASGAGDDAGALREQRDALRDALRELLECPYDIDPATVSSLGLEETMKRSPYQVVGNMSVALARVRKARAALAQCGEAPAASGAAQQTEPVVTIKRAAWQEFERLFDRGVSKGWIPQEDLIELYNALDPVSGEAQ